MLVVQRPKQVLPHKPEKPSALFHKVADAYVPALSQEIITTAHALRTKVDRDALARAFEARDPTRVENLLGLYTFKLSERRNIRMLILKIMQEKGDEAAARLLRMRQLRKFEIYKANEAAKQTGVMIALIPPAGVLDQLRQYAADDEKDNLHMTVAYLGKVQDLSEAQIPWIATIVKSVAHETKPLTGLIQGVGRFNGSPSSDGKDVFWAHVDMPGLSEFRQKLVGELGRQGIEVKADHGFTPHITLAYIEPDAPLPVDKIPSIPFAVDRVFLKIGDIKETMAFSVLKGDVQGHEFHGNQWTGGSGGAAAAVKEWDAKLPVNPFYERESILNNRSAIQIKAFDGKLMIDSIRSLEKGKGHGSEALKTVLALADKYHVATTLHAKAFGDKTLSNADLMKWYSRYGFKKIRGNAQDGYEMERPAQVAKGDVPGHEFHGNQYTAGGGSSDPPTTQRPQFPIGPNGEIASDKQIEEYRVARDQWNTQMMRALSLGKITSEQAKALGFLHGRAEADNWHPLPPVLYHVTTAADAVQTQGLKTNAELASSRGVGLGGANENEISLTTDPAIAESIHQGLMDMREVAAGNLSVQDMLDRAASGSDASRSYDSELQRYSKSVLGATGLQDVINGVKTSRSFFGSAPNEPGNWRPVESEHHWTGGDGKERYTTWQRDLSPAEKTEAATRVAGLWMAARGEAGGPANPVFFNSDTSSLAKIDPSQIRILQFKPTPGAQGFYLPGESEWRTGTGDAVQLEKIIKGDVPGHPFHGNQWTGGAGKLEAWTPSGKKTNWGVDAEAMPAVNAWLALEKKIQWTNPNGVEYSGPSVYREAAAQMLAAKTGLPEARCDEFLQSWLSHSSDSRSDSIAMQVAVAKMMGDEPGRYISGLSYQVGAQTQEEADRFVKGMYDATQQSLKDAGIDTLYVSRGVHFGGEYGQKEPDTFREAYFAGEKGADVKVGTSPMSSWSLNPETSMHFAQMGDDRSTGYVLTAKVPRERVVGWPFTGVGSLGEMEVVVAGDRGHTVHATVTPSETPIPHSPLTIQQYGK